MNTYPQKSGGLSTDLTVVVLDFLDDFRNLVVDIAAFSHLLTDLLSGIHNCCVVSVTEIHTDFGQGELC